MEWLNEYRPLGPTAAQLQQQLSQKPLDRERIDVLLCRDPVLALELLRQANVTPDAPPVTSLDQAVLLLGPEYCLDLAKRVAGPPEPLNAYDSQELLRHSMATGLLAGALARRVPRVNVDEASAAGLLHDLGKIVFDTSSPHQAVQLLDIKTNRYNEGCLLKEQRLFGATHAAIGALVASQWNLPQTLVNAIALHHHPVLSTLDEYSRRDREVAGIVFIANQLSKHCDCAADDLEIDLAPEGLLEMLGLHGSYEEILENLMDRALSNELDALLAEMALWQRLPGLKSKRRTTDAQGDNVVAESA